MTTTEGSTGGAKQTKTTQVPPALYECGIQGCNRPEPAPYDEAHDNEHGLTPAPSEGWRVVCLARCEHDGCNASDCVERAGTEHYCTFCDSPARADQDATA